MYAYAADRRCGFVSRRILSCRVRFFAVRFVAIRVGYEMKGVAPMGRNGNGDDTHYAAVNRSDVPQGRKGKHRKAVADILADLSKLNTQQAVKIPLSSLNGEKMQNLRSALNRVTRERNIPVETSSDEKFLYIWRADAPKANGAAE